MKSPAGRMSHLAPHFFAALSARIQVLQSEGRDIIRLDEGAPDLSLRQAWAGSYRRLYEVDLDPESEIIPLLGSKEGIFHLSLAFIEPGDIALVPDPGYITYTRGALVAGGEVYRMPLLPERGYLPDLESLPPEVLQRAKLMWLNYPNNPTAAVASLEFFAQAAALAREYGFLLCHDAAYMQVAFDGEQPPSLLQAPGAKEVAVEFNTLSKSHNMAGWRSAALLGNPEAVRALYTLKTNADSSHFLPVFEASTAALTGDQSWLLERNEIYRQRRDVVVAGLRQMGLAVALPRASLYVWSPIPAGWSSIAFATAALEQAGVTLTPGTVFGPGGEGFMRIAITAPVARVRQAMDRLGEWLAQPWSLPPTPIL
jgi:LL-diaminopimelate aminotransferase